VIKANLTDRATQVRFLRFLTVCGLSAGVQLAVLAGIRDHLAATAAFTVSFLCSTTTHYLLNRFWALPSERRDSGQQLGEYLFTVLLSYVINGRGSNSATLCWVSACCGRPVGRCRRQPWRFSSC